MADGLGAAVASDGATLAMRVHAAISYEHRGQPYVAALVGFVGEEAKHLRSLTDEPTSSKVAHPALLVLGATDDPKASRAVVVDERAACLSRGRFSVDDFMGIGEPQLRLSADLVYIKSSERYSLARRVVFYHPFVGSEQLAATTALHRYRHGATYGAMRKLAFVDAGTGQPRRLRLGAVGDGDAIELAYRQGGYGYREREHWDPQAVIQSTAQIAAESLRVRIVDPLGHPIPRARIAARCSDPTARQLMIMDDRNEGDSTTESIVVTNDRGEATLKLGFSLSVEATADGYYPGRSSWRAEMLPPDAVTVTLTPEPGRVPMTEQREVRHVWNEPMERLELGIDFDAPVDASPKGDTQDRQLADVWIEAVRATSNYEAPAMRPGWGDSWVKMMNSTPAVMPDADSRARDGFNRRDVWRLSVTGLNGWQIAVGPMKAPPRPDEDPALGIAPEDGYVDYLEFQADQLPETFFVRGGSPERFGIVDSVRVDDDTHPDRPRFTLRATYTLQKGGVGSRSLLPIKRPLS